MTTMKPTGSSSFNARTIAMIGIGLLLLLVFGLVLLTLIPPDEPDNNIIQLDAQGRIVGDENAPVVIREFADFRCPHCKDAAETLTPNIIEGYVESGQVRFEYVPVAVINEESVLSGQAALCAENQGRFWSYHEKLFAEQGRNVFSIENLTQWAVELDLNEQEFRNCLTSSEYLDELNANMRDFQASGATGTPTFLVNGQLVNGAVSWEEMQATIDAQLASAQAEANLIP
jgi:protein-disulfide isomerase